jgi:prepilin-type processing-associated H-X9-DG protein
VSGGIKSFYKIGAASRPENTVFFVDSINMLAADPSAFGSYQSYVRDAEYAPILNDYLVYFNHNSAANVGWLDGHVKDMRRDGLYLPPPAARDA